jgi:hypothetical protein
MSDTQKDDDFTPQEAQERFERALRAGLNMPPVKRSAKPKAEQNSALHPKKARSKSVRQKGAHTQKAP